MTTQEHAVEVTQADIKEARAFFKEWRRNIPAFIEPAYAEAVARHRLAHTAPLEAEIARLREIGQAEGFAAAVQWLRDRGACKPPATLWHAAETLADQMEQARVPGQALKGE